MQDDACLMQLVHDMLRPESLPRGWAAKFLPKERKW